MGIVIDTSSAPLLGDSILAELADDVRRTIGAFAGKRLTISMPLRVYSLSLDQAASAELPGEDVFRWRYLISGGSEKGKAITWASVDLDKRGGFAQSTAGSKVKEIADAIQEATSYGEGQAVVYELVLLECPGIFSSAVWLRTQGGEDVFFPVSGTAGGKSETFWENIQATARERTAARNRLRRKK